VGSLPAIKDAAGDFLAKRRIEPSPAHRPRTDSACGGANTRPPAGAPAAAVRGPVAPEAGDTAAAAIIVNATTARGRPQVRARRRIVVLS
jgi:hypothetical protein